MSTRPSMTVSPGAFSYKVDTHIRFKCHQDIIYNWNSSFFKQHLETMTILILALVTQNFVGLHRRLGCSHQQILGHLWRSTVDLYRHCMLSLFASYTHLYRVCYVSSYLIITYIILAICQQC